MDGPLRIRDMAPADCRRVSEIRVGGRQAAYRGLMPQSPEVRYAACRRSLAEM
jgi:hypothetical protein